MFLHKSSINYQFFIYHGRQEPYVATITDIYMESEKALFGTLILDDGTKHEKVVIPKSQIKNDGTLTPWIVEQKLKELSVGPGIDRFGRPVAAFVMRKVQRIGTQLKEFGFRESKNKPDLYYMTLHSHEFVGKIMVFADLRGSEVVPIYEETCPLIWAQFDRNYRLESIKKDDFELFTLLFEEELIWSKWDGFGTSPQDTEEYFCYLVMHMLELKGIPSRRTYDFFSVSSQVHHEYSETDAAKQAKAMSEYSSYLEQFMNEVKKQNRSNLWQECRICRLTGISKSSHPESVLHWFEEGVKLEMHHVSYIPEVVIPLCKKCHDLVHHSEEYAHLKPEMKRIEWLTQKKTETKETAQESETPPGSIKCSKSDYAHAMKHCSCNANFEREGYCQHCFTALRELKNTNDWDSRKYHKKCWGILVKNGEYKCGTCGFRCNDFKQEFCDCDDPNSI
jgi:hypothetical protein